MFEKEAEEIANKKLCANTMCYNRCSFNNPKHHRCGYWYKYYECAKEGAEFGYNKANEWHKVADGDLPKNRRNVYVAYLNGHNEIVTTIASFRHKFWVFDGHKTECEIIAWCELPKYIEE